MPKSAKDQRDVLNDLRLGTRGEVTVGWQSQCEWGVGV